MTTTVSRFSASERAVHWVFGLGCLALLATGVPLAFPRLRHLLGDDRAAVALRVHLVMSVLWVIGTTIAITVGDRRRLAATLAELTRFARADGAWLRRFPRWLVCSAAARETLDANVGRFNAGQKFFAGVTIITMAGLVATGIAVWPVGGEHLVHRGANWFRRAHKALAVGFLPLVVGHIVFALVHPATRAAFGGMLRGHVDRAWARRHHPRWVDPEDVR
jgi:formate dehydrogenase subunit gamma